MTVENIQRLNKKTILGGSIYPSLATFNDQYNPEEHAHPCDGGVVVTPSRRLDIPKWCDVFGNYTELSTRPAKPSPRTEAVRQRCAQKQQNQQDHGDIVPVIV
jgi:hypothetical protein